MMEGRLLVCIILPMYELLNSKGSCNILQCCYKYKFYELVPIDLFTYEVKLGKMPLERNAKFQILDVGAADQDRSLENDDQNFVLICLYAFPNTTEG